MEFKPQQVHAVVLEKKQLTKNIIFATFTAKTPMVFQFHPGQYAVFMIDPTTRRQYSFASAPNQLPAFSFVVDTSPGGPGSAMFQRLRVGQQVTMLAPVGKFTYEETERKTVFIATGTGIAPFRSMLLDKIANDKLGMTSCSLYWGLRYQEDIYWKEEFERLAGQYTNFQFFLTLSKPPDTWHGMTGHVNEHVLSQEKKLLDCDFYLCGSRGMIRDFEMTLMEKGVPQKQIKKDVFY